MRPGEARFTNGRRTLRVLRYILAHDVVWATTAVDIAEYYLANYYDKVKSWIADRKARLVE